MKKLTTPAGVFGPYNTVETLADRYRCDGADVPFAVVGEGTVEDWVGELPPQVAVLLVPAEVTARQAHEVMIERGLDTQVEAIIASKTDPIERKKLENWYLRSNTFQRDNPIMLAMTGALGLTPAQTDELFTEAATR